MEDLKQIIALGFSGSDVAQALLLTFTIAIILKKRRSAWFLGALALLIDRIVIPIGGMALADANIHSIYASIGAMGKTFVDDIGLYVVRYVGLVVLIAFFTAMRMGLQSKLTPAKDEHAHA
ncbi:MAG: hypothetical protein U5J99_05840 [Parvularculaceae bacterium]|nr:hypothetical protein [Parvularculaceae bacterium]